MRSAPRCCRTPGCPACWRCACPSRCPSGARAGLGGAGPRGPLLHRAQRLVTGYKIFFTRYINCSVINCSSCASTPQLLRARRRSERIARRPAQAGSLPHERGRGCTVGGRGPAGGRAVRPERHPHRARQPLPAVHRPADAGAAPAPHPGLHGSIRQQAGPAGRLTLRVISNQLGPARTSSMKPTCGPIFLQDRGTWEDTPADALRLHRTSRGHQLRACTANGGPLH